MAHSNMKNQEIVTTGKAASMLGVGSAVTIRAMCERGELEGAYLVGSWWRIPVSAIEKKLNPETEKAALSDAA